MHTFIHNYILLEATAQSKDAKKRKSGIDAAWTETYPWLQSSADGDGKCKSKLLKLLFRIINYQDRFQN